MKTSVVRVFAILSFTTLAACSGDAAGSSRLNSLDEGMTVDQAVDAMGAGPLTATGSDTVRLVNGYRRMRYFLNGANFEVVYARDLEGNVSEPLLQANETPAVFKDGKLMGWGWKYYVEEAMPKFMLPTPLRAVDTMQVYKADSARKDSAPALPPGMQTPEQAEPPASPKANPPSAAPGSKS
ncbi:hypothetical protein [Gemmatimonas sp.]|jgi:hypothetical protein|uniref:hypothetical protein n=1 Tax=Gemmatimonas sp. TaxID=1962908 RepID=UPI0037C0E356